MAVSPIRFTAEIGMHSFSRGRVSCRWKTPWCAKNCYNGKFYRLGWSKDEYDEAYNRYWRGVDSEQFVLDLFSANNYEMPARFRFAVCGEIWAKIDDVDKVMLIMRQMPNTLFWIPTRAWHDGKMAEHIERAVFPLKNARVLASVDPDTTPDAYVWLRHRGWSLVYSGDNENPNQLMLTPHGVHEKVTSRMHRCEKTWDERKGYCATCDVGCFSADRVEVHLKQHR